MDSKQATLCFLGCGNLGAAILSGLLDTVDAPLFSRFIVSVRTDASATKLRDQFAEHKDVSITAGRNAEAVKTSDVVILATDPTDVDPVLTAPHMRENLRGKLVISVAAGWTRQKLEALLETHSSGTRLNNTTELGSPTWVIRTLPNVAAVVHHSLTVIETPHPDTPPKYLRLATAIFDRVGRTMVLPPHLLDAATAVGGSTPAFFAIICEALIDAAVAVGVPRSVAHESIAQSMLGTARMLQMGMQPGEVKDKGTSPEGCTMSGLMVLEEGAVRGHVGRALREAVSVSRKMGSGLHLNDTR